MNQNVVGGGGIGDGRRGEWKGQKGEEKERRWWHTGEGKSKERGGQEGKTNRGERGRGTEEGGGEKTEEGGGEKKTRERERNRGGRG